MKSCTVLKERDVLFVASVIPSFFDFSNLPLLPLICSRHPSFLPFETLIPSLFHLFLIMTKPFPYYCTCFLSFFLPSFPLHLKPF